MTARSHTRILRQIGASFCLFAALGLPLTGAWAGGHGGSAPKADHGGGGKKEQVQPLDPKNVEVPVVPAPFVSRQGKLVGYAFVGVRIRALEPGGAEKIKRELPSIQAAIVRAINEAPAAADLDEEALKTRLLDTIRPAVRTAVPAALLDSVELRDIVRSEL